MLGKREFEALWDEYKDRLHSFLRGRLDSPEDAEDALQELFLRVHTGLCCVGERERLERWIYRIARNLVVDRYRSRRPEEAYEDRFESPYGEADRGGDPVAELAFSLRDMVDRLPGPHREALLLSDYEGLTLSELAARLGLSLPAAKSRVRRARLKLKALLLDCCHFELDSLGGVIGYDERCARCDLERAAGGR